MIIWSGWGILSAVFAIIGVVVGGIAGATTGALVGGIVGGSLAAFLNHLVAKAVNKGKIMIDPATNQQVLMKKSNSLFFIPMGFYTPLMLVGGIAIGVMGMLAGQSDEKLNSEYPGKLVFEEINDSIDSTRASASGGSNVEAEKAAKAFEGSFKSMQSLSFEGGDEKYESRKYPTYCHQNKTGIVFICQVPGLRKYKDTDAKEALYQIAWLAARKATEAIPAVTPETPLTVGLRGIASYGSIQQGTVGDEIGVGDSDMVILYKAFDPALDL